MNTKGVFYVLFRVDCKSGEVLAIFPEQPAEETGTLSLCYRGGRFAGIAQAEAMTRTRAATVAEYAQAEADLTERGYLLCVLKGARQDSALIRRKRARQGVKLDSHTTATQAPGMAV